MNASSFITKDYENKRLCRGAENKAKTNPNKANFKPGDYAQDDGMVPRMYFAILGGLCKSSVKWCIKIFSISFSVFSFASPISFKLPKAFAAFLVSLILSVKLASQSLQIRPLALLLK